MIFDIDLFKHINDTYGHDIGDKILQGLALLISKQIRTTDILARWGGEEFVIIFHNTALDKAFDISEELRKAIKTHTFYNQLKLTCSFGITQVIQVDTSRTLFKRVDNALYEAKGSGRNCTKVVMP